MRKEVTDLLLRDFGYDLERAEKKAMKIFGDKTYEELAPGNRLSVGVHDILLLFSSLDEIQKIYPNAKLLAGKEIYGNQRQTALSGLIFIHYFKET